MEIVKEFQGEYRFLSNFWPAPLVYRGIRYPSSEHAFQAAKVGEHPKWDMLKMNLAQIQSPGEVKRVARTLRLRPNWEEKKVSIMREIVLAKFTQNEELGRKLVKTGSAVLQEGNYWGDTFWGICKGKGGNWLGRILMEVREELQAKQKAA